MKNILILEDQTELQWIYLHSLSKKANIFPVVDIQRAIEIITLFDIDCCIVDIFLNSDDKDKTGIAFIKKIKEENGYNGKIVVISGFYNSKMLESVDAYVDKVFKKPCEIQTVLEFLENNN